MEYTADIIDHVTKEDEQKIYSELLKYNLEHLEDKEPKIHSVSRHRDFISGMGIRNDLFWRIIR